MKRSQTTHRCLSPDVVDSAIRHLRKVDPVMRELIRKVGPFQFRPKQGRFASLARSILAQQISTAVARTLWRRLEERISPGRLSAENLRVLSFDELRSIGLSRQKATYLHDLADKVLDGTVKLHRAHWMSDEEIIAELTQVKGIGRWTVQMFLMFCLGRADVFAPDDFGLRSAIQRHYGLAELPKRDHAETIAASWRPYSTVASWYLWRSLEL